MSLQERMDTAFENYLMLSNMLLSDLKALLDSECENQHWRRNFIRTIAPIVEGYAHCLREMCSIGLECVAQKLPSKEKEVLLNERGFNASDRIRLTLRAAYRLFELSPSPDFRSKEWQQAKLVFEKRDALMHPKTASDLEVSDGPWRSMREDVAWLIGQFDNFQELAHKKYG